MALCTFAMTEKEKLHSGDLYLPNGDEIMTEQLACLDKLYDFNMTRPTELDKREALLKEDYDKAKKYYDEAADISKDLIAQFKNMSDIALHKIE